MGIAGSTSLDGLGLALMETDGIDVYRQGPAFVIPYEEELLEQIRSVLGKRADSPEHAAEIRRAETVFTEFAAAAVKDFVREEGVSPDILGFAGHTICHRPSEHYTHQIGDGRRLAELTGIKTAARFRSADILAGGQGAPFAPVYYEALTAKMRRPLAVIDVGGTSVKEGLFDEDGNLLAKASVPTPPIVDAAGFAAVTEAIDQVVAKAQIPRAFVAGIGLAVPCPIPASGDAKVKANIAINLPELRIAIQQHCPDAVVKYENDANAAAMGEAWLGSAKGVQNVVMVTIGTGVGGGVIVNGDVVSGVVGAGGEIGHMCLNPAEERTCGCGGHGHLEQYSSATGVVRCMKKLLDANPDTACTLRGKDFEAKDVFDAARAGDALAAREVDEMASTLGMALANIAATTDPEMFMIGGGVARAGEVLFNPLVRHYKEYAFQSCKETPIKAASLGNDAGIYGAVRLIVGA